jgi:hypothetical protein
MLLSEFLAELKRSTLPWEVSAHGKIRCPARLMSDGVDLTPLCWVALKHSGRFCAASDISALRDALEMDVALVSRLWTATETPLGKDSLRPLLLKACKLEGV